MAELEGHPEEAVAQADILKEAAVSIHNRSKDPSCTQKLKREVQADTRMLRITTIPMPHNKIRTLLEQMDFNQSARTQLSNRKWWRQTPPSTILAKQSPHSPMKMGFHLNVSANYEDSPLISRREKRISTSSFKTRATQSKTKRSWPAWWQVQCAHRCRHLLQSRVHNLQTRVHRVSKEALMQWW